MGKGPKNLTAVVDSSCKTILVKCNSSFYLAGFYIVRIIISPKKKRKGPGFAL